MIWFLMIILSMLLVALYWQDKQDPLEFIRENSTSQDSTIAASALNMSLLTDEPLKAKIRIGFKNFQARIGKHFQAKVIAFLVLVLVFSLWVRQHVPPMPFPALLLLVFIIGSFAVVRGLQIYERKQFDASFPNALNMLSGAVSSGESLMHAIIFVGDSLEGVVGREFKTMGQRLSMGQTPDEVLRKSCQRFPYPPFYFFVITLRANINRGGQLKEIIRNLNQVMFNSEALNKKKGALTSEARTSAKIVAAIPICFLFMMKYMSPENYDFVMNQEAGRSIFYYVLGSEIIGLSIIWDADETGSGVVMTTVYTLLLSLFIAAIPIVWLDRYFARQSMRSWLGLSHTITGWGRLFHLFEYRFAYERKDVELNLIRAGIYNPKIAVIYFPAKIGLAITLMSLAFFFGESFGLEDFTSRMATAFITMVFIIIVPDAWLQARQKKRVRKVSSQLPYVIDLMAVCVQTGMTIEASIDYLGEELKKL